MQTLVLKSNSAVDIKLIAEIAKKMGIKAKILTDEEKEDIGMLNAIMKGKTGQYIDNEDFVKILKK
ncbi:MAG: hypothetical protein WBI06_05650 [Paludibacter sp.]